jgi:prepilin peptidase CpaA
MIWTQATIWNVVVVAFALTAGAGDARWRKIPKAFATAGILAGLGFHIYTGGFLSSLAACLIAFAVGVTFFQLGAIGGGDVKLITALAAMLGLRQWLLAMEIAIFVAAAMALVQAVRRGLLRQTLVNVKETMQWVMARGVQAHPVINASNSAMLRAPFGVAAALGTLVAVFHA